MKTSRFFYSLFLISCLSFAQTWEYQAETTSLFGGYTLSGPVTFFLDHENFYCSDEILREFVPDKPATELYGCSEEAVNAVRELDSRSSSYSSYMEAARRSANNKGELRKLAKTAGLPLSYFELALTCSKTTLDLLREAFTACKEASFAVRQLSFSSVTKDGSGWVMENRTQSPLLKFLVPGSSGDVRTKVSLTLSDCDGQEIAPQQDPTKASLSDLVSQLEGINLENFWQCTLKADMNSFLMKQADFFHAKDRYEHYGYLKAETLTVVVHSDGKVVTTATFPEWRTYFPRRDNRDFDLKDELFLVNEDKRNPELRSKALEASQKFLDLLKEHGRTIIRAGTAGLSQGEIQRLALESLSIRKSAILRELSTINKNYENLTFIDKLSISISVKRAYRYFQGIEARIGKIVGDQERLNLDGLINSPQRYSTPTNPIRSSDADG